MPDDKRVAVLGAYGTVGRRLVTQVRRRGYRVTAVGRDGIRLGTIAAHSHRAANVLDAGAMRRIASGHDIVVNASSAELPELARQVTDEGAAFVDISADSTYLEALAAMRPGRPVLAGTGLAPGLTNILADTVPGTDPLQIAIVAGVGERHGAAARTWIWGVAGERYTDGTVYRTSRRLDIPGLGIRTLLRAAFGEQVQLANTAGRQVTTWLALDPPVATRLLRLAGALPAAGRYLDLLSGPLARFTPTSDRWVVAVASGGTILGIASGHNQSAATALVTALSLPPVLAAPPGVWAAHQLLSISDIADDLRAGDIATTFTQPVREANQ